MPQASYDKRCIALTQLETALRLFEEGQDLFSVITLAGAAEELLGKLLSEIAAEPSLDSLKKAAVEMYRALFNEEAGAKQFADRANRAKNELKHHDKGSPTLSRLTSERRPSTFWTGLSQTTGGWSSP